MANLSTNLPVLNVPLVDANNNLTVPWLMFLVQLYQRSGADQTPALNLTQVQALALIDLVIASTNGFAGTTTVLNNVATVTLRTTVTGIIKGNGTSLLPAVSGSDYAPPTSGSSILYGNGAGGFSNVTVGSGLGFTGGTLSNTSPMVYPSTGFAYSTGTAWATSYGFTGIGTNVVTDNKPTIKEPIIGTGYTVATLPTGVLGMRTYVTDALAPVFLGVLVGGGAVKAPAFYNGTAWVAG
jgi:hypothetical protein